MPVFQLTDQLVFPHPSYADEDGILAVGGDLSPERLLLAYENGIFPWYDENTPILWWSPDPRMIIEAENLYISKSLKKSIRNKGYKVRFDTAFSEVIRACAKTPRKHEKGTWIIPEMEEAYNKLHELGFAHSIECWKEDSLVGGMYGISLGSSFFGESMFSTSTDASKISMIVLCAHMIAWEMPLLDCQVANPHLESLGGVEIPREDFLSRLKSGMRKPTRRGIWSIDDNVMENSGYGILT